MIVKIENSRIRKSTPNFQFNKTNETMSDTYTIKVVRVPNAAIFFPELIAYLATAGRLINISVSSHEKILMPI